MYKTKPHWTHDKLFNTSETNMELIVLICANWQKNEHNGVFTAFPFIDNNSLSVDSAFCPWILVETGFCG